MQIDVLIIGAGAAGLMCAIEAGKRGRKVAVLDHANKAAKKILMSGGGRCNFTNLDVQPSHFVSNNPHFCKSALKRYTQWDFIALVEQHNIAYHERDLGKLFCDTSAKDIVEMLLAECAKVGVEVLLECQIKSYAKTEQERDEGAPRYSIDTTRGLFSAESLIVACGGLSIPKMCASPLGYQIAEKFDHPIGPTRAGLVPLTLQPLDKTKLATLPGIAVLAKIKNTRAQFNENILFTHRGLSGPAVLQLSSYWLEGEAVMINLLPDLDLKQTLISRQAKQPNIMLKTALSEWLPKRLISCFLDQPSLSTPLQALSHARFSEVAQTFQNWTIQPGGTEGYRTAEVTLGGVDCHSLSSKTMESNQHKGLYFIGEVVDVSGWLGGYNFQWAWSSGWCAGQVV